MHLLKTMESGFNQRSERVGSILVEDLRKDLFTEFSKLSRETDKEHLQVYLRVRPFTATEREEESQDCITIEDPDCVVLKAPRASLSARHSEKFGPQLAQRFQFSQVYGPETTQRQIFDGTTKSWVKEVLEGGNSLIFTYGVTNAGKTYTFLGPDSDGGILPRSLNVIFNSIEGRLYNANNIKPQRCVDFTRLTKEQQEEEATNKRNLLRRFRDNDSQKNLSSTSSSSCSFDGSTSSDSICMDKTSDIKFSIWVSFCEIYNENIHDLLDLAPNGSHRRTVLRLAQDVKGNAFVKDLKWVQVSSSQEALKVVKIGRKNQSFSSTKLNNISSRSHSIFSIRVLRIEDLAIPRVQTISELSLCDLAGSERCAKTQNHGERLKEAGNINTSLLTLGKCINALRVNQLQPKFHQHVPFRESKLTHYLQGFFCGRGKACMIININQCASMYDETLNVLKFSAVAQKVVVLNSKPAANMALTRSARDVSMMINNSDNKEATRRSSFMGWEMSLEDVLEDENDEEVMDSGDESMEDNTVVELAETQELLELRAKVEELQEKLAKEESEKITMEAGIREEVTAEFMELFSNMEKDYREKEIVEERAERRLEILKHLVSRTAGETADVSFEDSASKEVNMELLDSMIESMRSGLSRIKGDAEAVQMCLTTDPTGKMQIEEMKEELLKSQQQFNQKAKELAELSVLQQEEHGQLLQANKNYENQKLRCQELMSICREKDDMLSTLQAALHQNVEEATKERVFVNSIKEEILDLRKNCKCKLQEEGKETRSPMKQQLLQDLKLKDDLLNQLQTQHVSLEKAMEDISERMAKLTEAHEAAVSVERAEVSRVTQENRTLTDELHKLQRAMDEQSSEFGILQMQLKTKTTKINELSEELTAARVLMKDFQAQSSTIQSLTTKAENLQQELCASQLSLEKKEAEYGRIMESCQEKSRRISILEHEVSQTTASVSRLETLCTQLKTEHEAQAQEYQLLLSRYEEQKFALTQIRSDSELLEELTALKLQLEKREEQDSGDDCWKILQDKFLQMLSKLNQHQGVLSIVQTIVQREISKARDEVNRRVTVTESELDLKHLELESNALELQRLGNLVNDERLKLESLHCDLQKMECERSDVRQQLCEANLYKDQLEKQLLMLTEEKKMLQQRLCNETEVQFKQLKEEESEQPLQTPCQDLATIQEVFQKPGCCLSEDPRQRIWTVEKTQAQDDDQQAVQPAGTLQPEILKEQQTTEQENNLKSEFVEDDHLLKSEELNTKKEEDLSSPTPEMGVLEQRFPKPELEISFTPLKPNLLNVRKPGEEESVTIKLRRSARKRKSHRIENSEETENKKNRRIKMPMVENQGQFMPNDSSSSLKKKKDGTMQKIGDFIQGSPTLIGSKAKRILSMVMSPELVHASENKPKRSKRKLFKTQVSSPMDIPSNPEITAPLPSLFLKMSKQKRLAYKVPFKLAVIKFAKEHGNRAAERHFGRPPTEKMIREWRKQEDQLQKLEKSRHTLRQKTAKWPELEVEVKVWITRHRQNGYRVSTKMIINEAKRIAVEKGIQDFIGSLSWCYRFLKRSGLSLRTKTRISQKMPKEYKSKILSFHKAHTTNTTKKNFKEVKTQIAVIPGGLTRQLQPLDVSINKMFKVLMREEWNTWMADDQ
ncbi:hypothetical protein DNTS_024128, partial [Danionella cerebrum]